MTNNTQNQTPKENGGSENLTKWLLANRKTIIMIIVVAIVAVGIFAIVDNLRDRYYQKQWTDVFLAEMKITTTGDPSNYASLEEMANKYKTKPAGVYAFFVLGTISYQQGDFLKAELFYKQALEHANEEFAEMITNTLLASILETGDFDKVVSLADEFLTKNPTRFSIPQIKLYKALGLEYGGKIEEAKEIYKSLEADYPQTYYAALAAAKLAPEQEATPANIKK
ncbi:MAG: tetratricopeptide repeat protein [Elusimicrobiaceae bacterium]|nr:tetratricopeptide repeat protein [Elusimicrobiaceae bacterium]